MLAGIRRLLDAHPRLEPTSAAARFIRFSRWSLDIEVVAYVLENDQAAFLAIQEDLLLGIMDIIDSSGTSVAFPLRSMDLAEDRDLDTKLGSSGPSARVSPSS